MRLVLVRRVRGVSRLLHCLSQPQFLQGKKPQARGKRSVPWTQYEMDKRTFQITSWADYYGLELGAWGLGLGTGLKVSPNLSDDTS